MSQQKQNLRNEREANAAMVYSCCVKTNCNQGRDCPEREPLTATDHLLLEIGSVLFVLLWVCVAVAAILAVRGCGQ